MGRTIFLCLLLLFAFPTGTPPRAEEANLGEIVLTVNASVEATFHFTDGTNTADDKITIVSSDRVVYQILRLVSGGWLSSSEPLDLKVVSDRNNRSASGGGSIQGPALGVVQWTYVIDPTRSEPWCGLGLNYDRGEGGVEVGVWAAEYAKDSITAHDEAMGLSEDPDWRMRTRMPQAGEIAHEALESALRDPNFKRQLQFSFKPKQKSFTSSGHASYTYSSSLGGSANLSADYSLTSYTKQQPVDDEMVFDPPSSYESWIPAPKAEDMPGVRIEPAAPLQVIARIQPKKPGGKARKGRIYFVLDEVSKHQGQCGNYPRTASPKDDLRFADEQPAGIVVDGKYTAHTSDEVSEAAVVIEATDTGAYGKLKASAPSLQLEAIYKPTNTYVLTIPRDDDGNHVADAWERQMNVHGTQDSDEDQVPGQDRTGDGLTYFDEYRGFVVVENGGKVFRRFDPKRKELPVIDPAGIFDSALWEQASGIVAYKLDESLIAGGGDPEASRLVNFNSDSGHPKYAARVVSMPGTGDSGDPGGNNQSMGETACGQCRSPKDADSCKVFPARIRAKIQDLYLWLGLALAQPTSPEGQELTGAGFPPWLAQRALDKLRDPASREALAHQFITQIAIHEVGHACGLSDHQSGSPPGMSGAPVRACPMYIPAEVAYHRFILLQTLFRPDTGLPMQYSGFCRGVGLPEFDCFRKLNVKDW